LGGFIKKEIYQNRNIYTSREEWLRAATNELRTYFEMFGYTVRIIPKWARAGLPICPMDASHGQLRCDLPSDDEATA